MLPGSDQYCTGPAQNVMPAGQDLDYLDRDFPTQRTRTMSTPIGF